LAKAKIISKSPRRLCAVVSNSLSITFEVRFVVHRIPAHMKSGRYCKPFSKRLRFESRQPLTCSFESHAFKACYHYQLALNVYLISEKTMVKRAQFNNRPDTCQPYTSNDHSLQVNVKSVKTRESIKTSTFFKHCIALLDH